MEVERHYSKEFKTERGARAFVQRIEENSWRTGCSVEYISEETFTWCVQWRERHRVNFGREQKRIYK